MISLIKSTFFQEIKTKEKLCEFITSAKKLSMDKITSDFEEAFSKYQGRKYSVFYNSGSSANLALIQALINMGLLKNNNNIGFSALTWATNVMPLIQLNLNPVPIDVSLSNLNITSYELLNSLKNNDLNCLFLTNLLGFSGDIDKISEICKNKGIILLEDNCESLGSICNGKKLGNFGLASTFSFFVGHHMSTIEGGMVCTDDKELYDHLLMVRAHGWSRNVSQEKKDSLMKQFNINYFYNLYTFYEVSYNFRPTEINSFLGLTQLPLLDEMNMIRQDNFKIFSEQSNKNNDFHQLELNHMDFISNFAYPLICKDVKLLNHYLSKFNDKVEVRPIVGGSMLEQPFFIKYLNSKQLQFDCPNAKKIHECGFYFPNNPDLTKKEKEILVNLIKNE
jgi:CDP-4-dehydro-6-deoxyglucose reductase, E1